MKTTLNKQSVNGRSKLTDPKNELRDLVIVDDEPVIRLLLSEFFKKKFSVVSLSDGHACLTYLESHLPEIIVLDLNMPDLSGLDVIRRIRENKSLQKIAIIVLSGAESSIDRINCLEAGADDFIIKPFNPRELDARINAILRRISQQH